MILKITTVLLLSVNSINVRMRVQQIFLWNCNHKYEDYTYQTLERYIKSLALQKLQILVSVWHKRVHQKGIKSSLIFTTKFISIVNEEEVEEEQLLIWKWYCGTLPLYHYVVKSKFLHHTNNMSPTCNHHVTIRITIHLLTNSISTCNHSVAHE